MTPDNAAKVIAFGEALITGLRDENEAAMTPDNDAAKPATDEQIEAAFQTIIDRLVGNAEWCMDLANVRRLVRERLNPALDRELCVYLDAAERAKSRVKLGEWNYPESVKRLIARIRADADELERLKRGDFTPDEFQNLCHSKTVQDGAQSFRQGCFDYWEKLGFGIDLIADMATLRAELERAKAELARRVDAHDRDGKALIKATDELERARASCAAMRDALAALHRLHWDEAHTGPGQPQWDAAELLHIDNPGASLLAELTELRKLRDSLPERARAAASALVENALMDRKEDIPEAARIIQEKLSSPNQ